MNSRLATEGLHPLRWRPSTLESYFGFGHFAADHPLLTTDSNQPDAGVRRKLAANHSVRRRLGGGHPARDLRGGRR